ncbi:MAG: hypothetical protein KF696_00840 [Planctomycetes bacterium]|nr:hypothetical protein [Planctomycetota bacterium]MCW8134515.1 hypothetical protein [Planctomycetota bacterium]
MRKFGVTLILLTFGFLAGCGGGGSSGGSTNVGLPPSNNTQPVLSVLGMSGAAPNYLLNVQQGNALPGTITLHGSDSDTNDNMVLSLTFNASASSGYSVVPAQLLINPSAGGSPATATTSATSPSLATITIAPNGALSTVGTIVFNANLTDDKGGASSATLTINVSATAVNNPPAIGRPSGPVSVGGNHPNYTATVQVGASLAFSATATDPDGDNVTLGANRTGGTLTASQAGFSTTFPASVSGAAPRTLTLAGTAAAAGTVQVSFTVNDGQGGSDTAVLLVTIQPSGGGGGSSVPTNGTGGATGTVNGAYQSRNYRLFVPTGYSQSTPTPLVIALHGAGDTYTNYFSILQAYGWTSAASSNNFILMAPQHMNSSRASFLHLTGSGGLDATATANEIQGVINAAYYGVGASYNIETTKIYFIGFSEGGVVTDITAYWHSDKIKAVAPYAGAATGKTFPITRNIPVYPICGTADSGYSGSVTIYNEWTNAGHATNNAWVSGVGHSFSQLCTTGPSPSSVYQWLATAQSNPVQSGYQGGGGPGSGSSSPSGGSGGSYPGNQQRIVSTAYGNQTYYLYIPSSYNPSTPMPVLFGFHGAGGSGTAPAAAQQVRNDWATVAATGNFIVVAQAATGSGGGWVPSTDTDILNSILTDVLGAYNIEQKRIYAWGFSAGAHYAHALCLNNSGYFAAYGISAGALQALAGTSAPAAAARKIPCSLYVGNSDPLQPNVNSDRQTFLNAGWTLNTNLWYTEFSGGHTYSTSHLSAIWGHIGSHTLP